jgi:probable rRNA maturation factor
MESSIEVDISDTQGHLRVDHAGLDRLVRIVLGDLDRPRASISIALVDDASIHAVNKAHLGHDWPTDVISFPLTDADDPVLGGELVISVEMACARSTEIGVEAREELALYVVHGLLHLCGFDDHDEAERLLMRQREEELLAHAGLRNPFSLGLKTIHKSADQTIGSADARSHGDHRLPEVRS